MLVSVPVQTSCGDPASAPTTAKSFSGKDVTELLDRLVAARPDLAEGGLVERAGVSTNITKIVGGDRKTLDATLCQFLDEEGFRLVAMSVAKVTSRVKISMKKMRKWLLTFTQLLC